MPIVFTRHAQTRMKEIGIKQEDLEKSKPSWKKCEDNIFRLMYKVNKYGQSQIGIDYWYCQKYKVLLTIKEDYRSLTCLTVTARTKKGLKLSKMATLP